MENRRQRIEDQLGRKKPGPTGLRWCWGGGCCCSSFPFPLPKLSNLPLSSGIGPSSGLLCPPFLGVLSLWGTGNVHIFLLLFQVSLNKGKSLHLEAPFWRGAITFSLFPVYWLGLNTREAPTKCRPQGPWDGFTQAHHCPRDTVPSTTLRRYLPFLKAQGIRNFFIINSPGIPRCFAAMDLV